MKTVTECRKRTHESRILRRKQRRKEHRCIWCGIKVKPLIIYPQLCPKHKPKKEAKEDD